MVVYRSTERGPGDWGHGSRARGGGFGRGWTFLFLALTTAAPCATSPGVPAPRTPSLTADVVILVPDGGVVLVRRKHTPPGWALPGGFVEVGETVEAAAVREAKEETGLDVALEGLLHVYSDPRRDPRGHTASAVFLGCAAGQPAGADDAAEARAFAWEALPSPIAFDHARILADARRFLLTGLRPRS
jgi:8-oxo-dGTP diphosphatase